MYGKGEQAHPRASRPTQGLPGPSEGTMAHTALILAAGRGTRMHSRLAKVLHPLCGLPMVQWVVQAAQEAGDRAACRGNG